MSGAVIAAAGAAGALAVAIAQLDAVASAARGSMAHPGGSADAKGRAGPGAWATGASRSPAVGHGVAAAIGAGAGLTAGGAVGAVVAGGVGAVASVMRARRGVRLRRRARERAAPSLARALADALRGGASVRGAISEAAGDRAVPAALRTDVADLAASVRLGAPLGAAFEALATQGDAGLRLLCGTVVMHLETGGRLASELDRLAADGEAALKIDEDRIAATAQARATVRVVAALPVVALLGAEAASGSFVATIARNPLALGLLVLGFLLEGAAIVVAQAIVGRR